VNHIKKQLSDGKAVIVTSGLYAALQGKGIEDIVELEVSSRRFIADNFVTSFWPVAPDITPNEAIANKNILFPQLGNITNDSWILVAGTSDGVGYPVLLLDRYGKAGRFYVWTIPDNQHHLYQLPVNVTTAIKDVVMAGFPVRLDGPSQVALFAYDNDSLVVESYLPGTTTVKVSVLGSAKQLRDLDSGELIGALPKTEKKSEFEPVLEKRTSFEVQILPHSFRGFKVER
jgi:hypothetical protein